MEQQGKYVNADPFAIKQVMQYGYNRMEAINILNGRNPDGSEFDQLPF